VTTTDKVLRVAIALRRRFVGDTGYGLAYGSHPAGTASATSDLDLVLISPAALPHGGLDELVEAVHQLHHDHGLALDTEVDHHVKVHATVDDMTAAIALRGLATQPDGSITVPPVVVQPWFLNSEPFRLRLLFNALTSPHAFLGGDSHTYRRHRHAAERSLALLALSLTPPETRRGVIVALSTLAAALTSGPDDAAGEDYLGYTDHDHLLSTLTRGLGQLACDGINRDIVHEDTARYLCDRTALRAAVRDLGACRSRPATKEVRAPWDNEGSPREDASLTNHEVVPLLSQLADQVSQAITRVRPELADPDPVVRPSDRADFQANAALALAKRVSMKPRDLAEQIREQLDSHAADVEVSGPGFVNVTLPATTIWAQVAARLADPRLGVGTPESGRRTVIDYSAPNVAKEMHVGHLRTTIIGDSLARVLGFLGADVIRQNHLGDWGTQFGMLIQYLDEHPDAAWHHDELSELERGDSAVSALDELYRAGRAQFDADPDFAARARARVVELQAGDPTTVARWKEIVAESEKAFRDIYDRLDVLLQPEDTAGESMYNAMLADTIDELVDLGLAVPSDGALVIFSETETKPDGTPLPLMVRKSDGGYGYDTTDLATIRYRIRDLKATRLIYVTDFRQGQHFTMIFEAARRAAWLTDDIAVTHVAYGTILGPDGRPYRTRAGGTVRLTDLLNDAVDRARTVVAEKAAERGDEITPEQLDQMAETAGIGAVKYADLSTSRGKDYTFDVDRMVSFIGNTGVYLQYAHTRIRSILRKVDNPDTTTVDITVDLAPEERALALALDGYAATLAEVADTLEPHRLCGYLYDLARAFTTFYEACNVLNADEPTRANRLALCQLTARTLHNGLNHLGITAPESM
jgi:arginyl-tRNA synthetase